MTNQEMINEMIELQRAYDNAVYKEFGCGYNKEKCTLAMIDEIGEFNHEIKKSWCWWKKSQKEIDWDKALEELVDIWHFALSLTYHQLEEHNKKSIFVENAYDSKTVLSMLYFVLINNRDFKLESLYAIGMKFGFDLKTVYEAYKKKNKINWERLANGY